MSGRVLKVLVLADSRSFHTERYVAELQRQGCEVLPASLEPGGIEHYPLRRRGPIAALHYPLAVAEVGSLIRSFQPDVLDPHFASGYGFLAALVSRRQPRPILLHLWGSDILIVPGKSFFHRRKTRLALETADFVVGDSDYLLSQAGKIGHLSRCRAIAWGIERRFLDTCRRNDRLNQPLRIIVPRPHEAVYNNLFIVRALAGLINDGRIEVTFPGFGGESDRFRSTAVTLVGERLKFYSRLPRNEYVELVGRHDVYLSAARSDSSPASLLEAMGLGLIPIAGDIPGVREWLTPDSGYLFDLDSERSLHGVVAQLLGRNDSHELMCRGNRERVEQKAIFEDNIAETINIMRELVDGSKR